MKWEIIAIGKPSLSWAREAADDYSLRLRRMISLEITALRPNPASNMGERMLEASAGSWRVALDERGKMMSSEDFAKWIKKQELAGRKRVSILIGGADGHGDAVRSEVDEIWSLSPMTLQHELAQVVFLEQLYRASSILRGEPYHRK
ncbi:MAG: 23S rRNA (pseudouridine(1915)-N(3))-methyltransferase RlmH [Verrucomicrobia bacterium]|nr:23S rRNA (pseudouridine(1915)-N(3))-methyltransferase RlmH [Verrucomicrobiota bacterium]